MCERDFSRFWERKASRLVGSLPAWRDASHRDPVERAERRRAAAWVQQLCAGPPDDLVVSVDDAIQLVHIGVDRARDTGQSLTLMSAVIPVATHRSWCDGLTALTDAGGWPRLNGVEVRADVLADPPAVWQPGEPAIETDGDCVTVTVKSRWPPLLQVRIVSSMTPSAKSIYERLRDDGWTIHRGIEAAHLLDTIDAERYREPRLTWPPRPIVQRREQPG